MEEVTLKARIIHDPPNHWIEVYVVGKWRPVRFYGGQGYSTANKKILADMEHTVRINTGSYDSHGRGIDYNVSKGSFAGKKINFEWILPEG